MVVKCAPALSSQFNKNKQYNTLVKLRQSQGKPVAETVLVSAIYL